MNNSLKLKDVQGMLPVLPLGYEWELKNLISDTYILEWEIRLVHYTPRLWWFDKRTVVSISTFRSDALPLQALMTSAELQAAKAWVSWEPPVVKEEKGE